MASIYAKTRRAWISLLDRLTAKRGIGIHVNSINLRMQGRFWHYYPHDYEKENFDFLRSVIRRGAVCLDIGGHAGLYAVCMAKLGATEVFSFEPTPSSFKLLEKTISLNHFESVIRTIPAAVTDKSGKGSFFITSPLNKWTDTARVSEVNSFATGVDFGNTLNRQELEVNTFSIDDFCRNNKLNPTFIKIDAEGSELAVLKGAIETLRTRRPSGILGLHSFAYRDKKKELSEIWELLNGLSLQIQKNGKKISFIEFSDHGKEGLLDIQFTPIQ